MDHRLDKDSLTSLMGRIRALDDDTRRHVDLCIQRMQGIPPGIKSSSSSAVAAQDDTNAVQPSARFPCIDSVLSRVGRNRRRSNITDSPSILRPDQKEMEESVTVTLPALIATNVQQEHPCPTTPSQPTLLLDPTKPLGSLPSPSHQIIKLKSNMLEVSSEERQSEFKKLREWRESRHRAAVTIQRHWRGFSARSALAEEVAFAWADQWMRLWRLRSSFDGWWRFVRVRASLKSKVEDFYLTGSGSTLSPSASALVSADLFEDALRRGRAEGGAYGMAKAFSDHSIKVKIMLALLLNVVQTTMDE